MKYFLLSISLFLQLAAVQAQKISGIVQDEKGNPLGFASISIKGTTSGVVANAKGQYEIRLNAGAHTIICQHVGYQSETKSVNVEGNTIVNFRLVTQQLKMEEVIVKRGADPAIEIMRKAIAKREFYNKQVDEFKVDVYIKSLFKTRSIPDIFLRDVKEEELEKTGFDSLGRGIIFLSESNTRVSFKKPDTYKYEVLSSRQAGGGYGISLPFFINFYVNNVQVFDNLNPRGFVSPVAEGAFHYYRFRYEGSFFENNKLINRIRVTPKRKNEPLFQGYIQIVDEDWRIHSFDLLTTKEYQLQLIDTVRLTQIHAPVSGDIWRTQNQVVYLAGSFFGFDWTASILNVYTDYNLEPSFEKKHFTRTIMSYDTAFNKKDSVYWNATRPIPLEPEERRDFVIKDSMIKRIRDSLQGREEAGVSFGRSTSLNSILYAGYQYSWHNSRMAGTYNLNPLLKASQFNTVEGFVPDLEHRFRLSPAKGKRIYHVKFNTRYGFSNQHFNAAASFGMEPKRNYLNRYVEVAGGKRVSQFNKDNPVDLMMNTAYTLFRKRNYLKIYENWFGEMRIRHRHENGIGWNLHLLYEDRIPLVNTTNYSFGKEHRNYLPNHPFELSGIPFQHHQAAIVTAGISWQPGQRYVAFPHGKQAIGSDKAVFELVYSKGISRLLGSDVDFDKWLFTTTGKADLKLRGEFRFRIGAGGFLNRKKVEIPDFTHFNGNQIFTAQPYLKSFQLAPYYQYSNTEKLYGILHAEHHFNGFLTNKIPLFNKLKWNLVGGINSFYVNRDNYYLEAFAGLENIFKLLRVDFVFGYQALPGNSFGVRLGLGGLLGDAMRAGLKN